MAFAKWQYPYTLTAEQAAEKEEVDGATELWPEGANVELCEEFWGKLRAGRKKWIRHEKDFCESLFSWLAVWLGFGGCFSCGYHCRFGFLNL